MWDISEKYHKFPQPKSPDDFLFCSTNNPKPEYIQFTTIWNTENQQILPFEKLEAENLFLMNDKHDKSVIKIAIYIYVD